MHTEKDFEVPLKLRCLSVVATSRAMPQLRQAASVNSMENFAPIFDKQLENLLVERMEGNEDIFSRMMNDDAFRNVAATYLMKAVYRHIANASKADSGIAL